MVRLLKIAAEALVRDLGGVILPNTKLGKITPPQIPDHYSAAIWCDEEGDVHAKHSYYNSNKVLFTI